MAINFLNSVNADSGVLYVDADNNRVGIGTTSPDYKLDVDYVDTSISSNPTLRVRNSWAGEGNNIGFSNKSLVIVSAGNDTVVTKIQSRYDSGANIGQVGTTTDHDFLITTNNLERLRLDTSGNLQLAAYTAGYLKSDASGNVTVDNSTFLQEEVDTLASVTGRGASTSTETFFNNTVNVNASGVSLQFGPSSEGSSYNPVEATEARERYWLRFDTTDDASFPYLTNRTPSGAVVIKTGIAAGGGENEHFRIKGGDGTVDAYFTDVNLGVGTDSPNNRLHVRGRLGIERSNGAAASTIDMEGNFIFNAGNGYNYKFRHNGTDLVQFNQNGNVGIGTTSPSEKLVVAGVIRSIGGTNDGKFAQIYVNDNYAYYTTNAGVIYMSTELQVNSGKIGSYDEDLSLETSGTTRITVSNTTGNVGIGTTNPDTKIHISDALGNAVIRLERNDNAIVVGDTYGSIEFEGQDANSGASGIRGSIHGEAEASLGQMALVFSTAAASVANAEKMRISSNGNVGIGTTSPNRKLHVAGDVDINDRLYINKSGENTRFNSYDANGPYVSFRNNGTAKGFIGSAYHLWVSPNNSADNFGIRAENQLDFGIGASVKMTLNSSGNVGIGTTVPTAPLHIVQPSTSGLKFSRSGHDDIDLSLEGANRFVISNTTDGLDLMALMYDTGAVGIGTTNPSAKLHVNGQLGVGTLTDNGIKLSVDQASTFPGSNTANSRFVDFIGGNSGANTEIGGIRWLNTDGDNGNYQYHAAGITSHNGGSSNDGDLRFFVSSDASVDSSIGVIEAVRINTNGNVGIGTNNPLTNLHIANSGTAAQLSLERIDTSDTLKLVIGSSYGYLQNTTGPLALGTSGANNQVYIATDGNVGIGTTSPTPQAGSDTTLVIEGSSSPSLQLNDTGQANPWGLFANGDGLRTYYGTDIYMAVKNDGNVGIGTTSPSEKLDVNGGIRAYGSISSTPGNGALLGRYNSGVDIDSGELVLVTDGKTGWDDDVDELGRIRFYCSDGSGIGARDAARIVAINGSGNGSGTTTFSGELAFFTSDYNANIVEALRIDRNGKVGIGTTSPTYKLHTYSADNRVYIEAPSGQASVDLKGPDKHYRLISQPSSGGSRFDIYDQTSSSHRFTINTSGNVGIGTTSPKAKLDVNGRFVVDSKTMTITDSFSDALTVVMSNHTGCYVKITAFGDWGSHSSISYLGEFFLNNGAGSYNEPGMIIRQIDGTDSDAIQAQIVDPGGTSGDRNFTIQLKATDTASFTAYLTYTIQGMFVSAS